MGSLRITLIGAGNVAAHLGPALRLAGHQIVQVFSSSPLYALELATRLGSQPVSEISAVHPDSDLYLFMLKDESLASLGPLFNLQGKLVVHTSGSSSIDLLQACSERRGVLYPLQTFSRGVSMDLHTVPFFIESTSPADLQTLRTLASGLSSSVHEADSLHRKEIHLAAVFASNFTNHMYAISAALLEQAGIPFEVMSGLISQTAAKAIKTSPVLAQTGPAARHDQQIMDEHLELLKKNPGWQQLYATLSRDIQKMQAANTLPDS